MARNSRIFGGAVAVAVVAISLGPLTALADKEGTARAAGDAGAPPPATPTTARGANFLIKSQLDANFCVAVATGTNEGRTITLQQCSGADVQRWAFSLNADDTNPIIEAQGMCLDGRARKSGDGLPLPVAKCRFGDAWRFTMTASGLIKDVKNNKCLSIPGAASNAAVSLADCDETKKTQLWKLAH